MIEYAMFSDKGKREHNEDSVGGQTKGCDRGCFVLCDGLGGHGYGEVASNLVVGTILQMYSDIEESSDFISLALLEGQKQLITAQRNNHQYHDMKTTAVILWASENSVQWGHVGDSRLYYFENNRYVTRTLDHSVPQMLVSAGEIKEQAIRMHPDCNKLLKVMGMEWDSPKFDVSDVWEKKKNQAFLLCSDGFWKLIEEKQMLKCLKKSKSPQQWIEAMQQIVLKKGADLNMDNYSAIAVFIKN